MSLKFGTERVKDKTRIIRLGIEVYILHRREYSLDVKITVHFHHRGSYLLQFPVQLQT